LIGLFSIARLFGFGPAFLFGFAEEDMVFREEPWRRRGRRPFFGGILIRFIKNTTRLVSRIYLAGNPPCVETAARCKGHGS
jgi:hypothetical protein